MKHKRNGSTSFTIPRNKSFDIGSFSKYFKNIPKTMATEQSPKKAINATLNVQHTINSFTKINNTGASKFFGFKSSIVSSKGKDNNEMKPRNPRNNVFKKNPIKLIDNTINNTLTFNNNTTNTNIYNKDEKEEEKDDNIDFNNNINDVSSSHNHSISKSSNTENNKTPAFNTTQVLNTSSVNLSPNLATTMPTETKIVKTELYRSRRSNSSIPNDTDRKSFAKYMDNDNDLNFVNVVNNLSIEDDDSMEEIYHKTQTKKIPEIISRQDTITESSYPVTDSLVGQDKCSVSRYGTNDLFHNKEGNKILSIKSQPYYDLSSRLINDEQGFFNKLFTNRKLNMLNNIRQEVKFKVFNSKKFLQLPDVAMYNILSFAYLSYDKLCQHKLIRKKLYLTLVNQFSECVNNFRSLYKDIFDLQEYYFKPKVINRGNNTQGKIKLNNLDFVLDLVLKSKIISNKINKCEEISVICEYDDNKKQGEVIQTWRFDIRKKADIHFWFASETEEVFNI
jgi:hypothetical protein